MARMTGHTTKTSPAWWREPRNGVYLWTVRNVTSSKTASASMDTSWPVKELSRTHQRFPPSRTWSHPTTLTSSCRFSPQSNTWVHSPQICQISAHHSTNSLGKTSISSGDLNTRKPLKCTWHEIFYSLIRKSFKMMKNGVYFIVLALLVAELFKILVYAN